MVEEVENSNDLMIVLQIKMTKKDSADDMSPSLEAPSAVDSRETEIEPSWLPPA